jgi:hypothetical protein
LQRASDITFARRSVDLVRAYTFAGLRIAETELAYGIPGAILGVRSDTHSELACTIERTTITVVTPRSIGQTGFTIAPIAHTVTIGIDLIVPAGIDRGAQIEGGAGGGIDVGDSIVVVVEVARIPFVVTGIGGVVRLIGIVCRGAIVRSIEFAVAIGVLGTFFRGVDTQRTWRAIHLIHAILGAHAVLTNIIAAIEGGSRDARSALTRIRLGTRVAIAADGPVGFGGTRARTRHWIARADIMALIRRRTRNRSCTDACACLARVVFRARIVVSARRTIRRIRIATHPRGRIACAGVVALILRRTNDRIRRNARSELARIRLRARIAIVTRRTIRHVRELATRRRIARIAGTRIGIIAGHRRTSIACSRLARIRLRAGIAILARGTIGHARIAAYPGCRITRPNVVTLIQGCAGNRKCPAA